MALIIRSGDYRRVGVEVARGGFGDGLLLDRLPSSNLRRGATSMDMAKLHRLGPGDEYFRADARAAGCGDFAGIRVDFLCDDALGRIEAVDVAILAVLVRALHEVHPNRQRALSALQLQIAVIVEANPDDTDDLGSKSGKPAIAVGAGFARGGKVETARMHARGGAGAHDFLHHLFDQVCYARVQHLLTLRVGFPYARALTIANRIDHAGGEYFSAIREYRVRRRDLDGHYFVSSQRNGRRGLDVDVQSDSARNLRYLAESNHLTYFDGGNVERVHERGTQRDRSHELFAEIAGRIRDVVEIKRGRLIDD